MDEKQIKLLWDLDAKNGGFSSYDEFRTLMQNDNARKAYFDASNKDLGFKDYDEFETTLGVKKKEGLLSSVGSYGTPSQMGSIVGGAVGTLNGNSQKLNGSNISSVSSTVEQPVNVDDDPVKFALSPYRAAANKALTDLQNVDKSGNESIGSMGDFGIKLDVSRSGLLRDEYNKRAKALNQAEQQSNNLFRTTANAYNYLVKKNEENNGTLPDDNETVNLALKKVSNAQAIDDLWKKTGKYTDANKNFENFAFNLIEGKNSDNAPEAKRGEYVYETLNDPTVIERASLNPEFNKALRTANANLYNNYPSFANKKIGQDLAQIMEDNKMINALYDNPGTDKTDKAANLLLNEGKWGNREYNYYIKKIRPIVERGDADKIIPLTDIAHQAGYALYEGTKGYNQSMRDAINFLGGNFLDKNGNSLWQNLGLLESNQSEQQRKEQEKYATPFAKPKGVKAYIESPINMAAGIAPMILGGMVGVPSSVNMALQFGSGNAEKANDIFPGNDIKSRSNRFAYTLASTSIDMTLMDLLPINKLLEAKRALEPTIRGTIRSLANGEISRAEVKPLLLDKLGNYLKTVPKNLIENANVLTAYNYAHAGLGALAGDRNIKAEEIGQNLIGDYLNNLLAGSALSLLHFKPGDKPRFEEAQYLRFANNYGAYKTALENRLKEHPEESQSINEKLDNLLYLKNVKDGMNPDMSDKKKARLLTISLKEKVLNDAKRAMPDKDLFDNSKIDELKKQKEEVLNTEEKPEEKVEPTESRETSKMPQTDDEWKESIATAPDEATKDELMKKHGEWIIAQKKVSDKVKSKLSEFKLEEEPEAKGEGETEIKGQAVPDEASNPSIQSAVINVGGKQYEGKNHAEAILKAKADGQDISSIDRQAEGKFKLSDGTIIDRNEAMQKFGNDKAELLIPQDEVAKQADKDYAKEIKNNSNLDKTQEDVKLAKEFAKNSNKYATLQTDIENASYYHDKLKAGESYNSVLAEAKENEQEGSAKRIVNLAHLNPKGKAMEALEALDKGEGDTKDNVLKIASKIGDIRSNNPHLTDAHENELFDHFVSDKDNIPTDKEINDPNNQINRSINAVRFDTNEPLNLEKFQNKSDARIEWENRRKELEQQVSELRQEVNPSKKTGWTGLKERIIAKLTGGGNSKKAIDKAAEGFNSNKDGIKDIYDKQLENEKKELQVVSDKLAKHLLQEKNIIEGDKRQQSLFHTTESESPKLSQMKDIVKDLVDEGYTNLSDIHEIVARETKNDSPKLKQLVTDAYNEYGKEKENTSTEVTSGVIGKVSQWLKKVFGEDNPNEPKILSSKDDADFERRVREDAGKEDGDVLFHRGKKPFGGNSGYSGYSMSKRAEQAHEDGKLPYSKLPAWAKRMVDAGLATTDEWHHTSSYGNETPFYNLKQFIPESKAKEHGLIDEYGDVVAGKGFKDISKEVIKELDVQSKEALKKKNNVKAVRKSLIDKAQKELDDFNAKFKRYSRVSKSPEHGITDLSEMNGKYGWFDSSGKSYNLPEYHSGIDYETAENRQKAKVLQKQLSDSKNKPIYEIELGKRGFDDKESNQLKELGIIDSEIMPENFYNTLERNKYIIKEQLKELSELPKPNEKFNPRFKKSLDDFLTDEEKQSRRNRHNYISEQGEDFGSSYERRLAHEENDGEYNKIASERYDKAKEDYLNSDEVKKDEIEFNEQKQKAQKIVNNINELFNKNDSDVLFHKSPEGKILGATVNGKIYLNGNHINPNTPIHEAGHIWVEVAKQHTPEIYDRGIKLVSDADNPYMKKVKSNEFYKSEASKAGKEGSPEYEQYMQHEALAMAIGDKGAQFVTEAKKSAFKEWLSNLWDMVKKAAGFKDITTEELQNLTFDEFTKRAARDILQGEVPEKESGGIRHADTKIIRERHGFEPYEKKPQTEEQWEQEAERRIKENPDAVNELLDRIDKSQRNEELGLPSKLDTDEADQKILDIHVNKLDKELQSNPSPEKLQELRRAVSLADYSGTKLGRELRSRRGSGLPMDSLGQFLLNKENAQGANLTDKQIIEQSEKYQELKKAHDEFKEAYEREKAEKEKLQIENDILKKGNKGNNTKKTKSDYVSERKSLIDILKKQKQEHEDWLKEQGIQKMGFGITLTTDMTKTILKIAKSYAEEGVGKLETLVDKVGEALKDVFPEITNSDILDVLGNKYKTQEHEKTRAEHKNVLKSLRKEAELIRKIADARKVIQNEKNERTKAQKTKRIQELEEQYNKIKANNEKEFSEEDLQNSLMDRIRKVSQDLKTKNFLKEKPKNKVNIFEKLSPKTTKLQDHLISLQVKRDVELYKDQLSKRTKWQKGWDIVQNVLGIKRLAQTSIDVSLLGRQLSTVTKNPRRWKHVPKIVRGTLLSFVNPKVFNRIMFNIKSDPDYQQILKDGLHFIEFESPDVERRSDLFPMKSFLYDVPYLRKPFLASNRAADAAANIARYELYKQGEKRLIDQKITRQDHPEEYEGLARWVNTITGSGKMLKFIEESHGAKKFLGNTLYGAKLMASRFNMLSPKYWAKLPPAVRREAIKDMISFTGTLMAMGMAARIAGARVSLNPNDSEFLKIRIGNNVYDITGGIGNYVRMFLRLSGLIISRGKYLTGNMGERENERNIGRGLTSLNTFVQSKLAPNTSFALSALTGKNAIGQPFDPYDVIRAYPMYFDDVWDGFKDSGFTSLFTVLLPSLEGEGVNVYPPRDANFSQEFKDNTVIKYYTDKWGMQLPNVRLENQKVPNTKKTIDEYPKEKQDEYIKVHNNELLKILTYIKNRGYVYKSEEDNISLYGNPGDEQIRLDDLNDDWDRGRVMSLAQRRASLLAKRKVFGR